ncbi:MAG: hypothetical protein KBC02_01695 [Candidatus Pacebacteria bacterium]|nr:hypothetical protein [Candidatus Paceibacterota bacterium]
MAEDDTREFAEDEEMPIVKDVDRHRFYFETGLYDEIPFSRVGEKLLQGDVDAYNPVSRIDTTYTIEAQEASDSKVDAWGKKKYYLVTLKCKRKETDVLRFLVYVDNDVIVKLGQQPSLADIQFADIGKKYDKLLPREDLSTFKKAIGLAAHGAGAGSLIYLRRIFENLIFATYRENHKDLGISEDDFRVLRMAEKVERLSAQLPSQLVEMKSAYGVLSKGVHELTEAECLAYFPVLKLSIELILEQKIEMDTKAARDASVKKQLAEISEKLK